MHTSRSYSVLFAEPLPPVPPMDIGMDSTLIGGGGLSPNVHKLPWFGLGGVCAASQAPGVLLLCSAAADVAVAPAASIAGGSGAGLNIPLDIIAWGLGTPGVLCSIIGGITGCEGDHEVICICIIPTPANDVRGMGIPTPAGLIDLS